MITPTPHVLFLCTGNYYRSRFAEHLFNHLAKDYALSWQAYSRGLATELVEEEAGPISPFTLQALAERGIPMDGQVRPPIQVSEHDLACAHQVIALKQAEHQPLLSLKFPAWAERVEYWHVHDIDFASPEDSIPQIEEEIHRLLKRFASAA